MDIILDAHALMIFLEKEQGFETIESLFASALQKNTPLLMTSVNFGEVFYIILRECGQKKADEIEHLIKTLPIHIVAVDIRIAKAAAHYKASRKMSYADCFAAALAKLSNGKLVTGDKEFREVEKEIQIVWV